jgi:hypothetical protein
MLRRHRRPRSANQGPRRPEQGPCRRYQGPCRPDRLPSCLLPDLCQQVIGPWTRDRAPCPACSIDLRDDEVAMLGQQGRWSDERGPCSDQRGRWSSCQCPLSAVRSPMIADQGEPSCEQGPLLGDNRRLSRCTAPLPDHPAPFPPNEGPPMLRGSPFFGTTAAFFQGRGGSHSSPRGSARTRRPLGRCWFEHEDEKRRRLPWKSTLLCFLSSALRVPVLL